MATYTRKDADNLNAIEADGNSYGDVRNNTTAGTVTAGDHWWDGSAWNATLPIGTTRYTGTSASVPTFTNITPASNYYINEPELRKFLGDLGWYTLKGDYEDALANNGVKESKLTAKYMQNLLNGVASGVTITWGEQQVEQIFRTHTHAIL